MEATTPPPSAAAQPAAAAPAHAGSQARQGLSAEVRRFSAGIRVVTAMLCTLMLFDVEGPTGALVLGIVFAYDLWVAYVLWAEASGNTNGLSRPSAHYWVDVAWSAAVVNLAPGVGPMMIVTLVQPVVLMSIGYGVRRGMLLAACAAVAITLAFAHPLWFDARPARPLPAFGVLGVLALVPAAAGLSKPMSTLGQRLSLIGEIESTIDPRRGLESVASTLTGALRSGTEADVAALILPSDVGAPVVLSTDDDGTFLANPAVHRQLERLLADMPSFPVSHVAPRRVPLGRATRVHGGAPLPAAVAQRVAEVAALLEVRALTIVPLIRYHQRNGHVLIGRRQAAQRAADVATLAGVAPELPRILETAALVDQLQDDSAALERSRIGRDLHDTAVQPYLGLKYAVEAVAMRTPPENPVHADIHGLVDLVNHEVAELRSVIARMRSGEVQGDNALVPSVRRQLKRFATLFGIEVNLDCPEQLHTSRELAGALFHMLNEALNNVRRHTPARQIWVTLAEDADGIRLSVLDDASSVRGQAMAEFQPTSLGERARALGGRMVLDRPDGLNTRITITVPRPEAPPHAA